MQVYLYNKETLIYEGEREARLDVLETKKQGQEVYAKPFNSTFTKLPELKDGQTAIYDAKTDSWRVIPSNIGKYVVNTKNGDIAKVVKDRPIRTYEVLITEEQYAELKAAPDKFAIKDNALVDISGSQEYQNKVNIAKYNNLIRAEKEKFNTFLNTPVKYQNTLYLPRYLDDYEKLQLRAFPQEIWDANGTSSKIMSKADFMSLKTFLEGVVNKAYKEKKENIKRYKLAIKKLEG